MSWSTVADDDMALRSAMFTHLDGLRAANADRPLRSGDINTFAVNGRALRLIQQSGIHKPAGLEAALTIRTTYTPPHQRPPYLDDVGADGLVRYKYHRGGPDHSHNRALRTAMQRQRPLAYFIGVDRGTYLARYPVWIVGEDRSRDEFAVAVDEGQLFADLDALPGPRRAYLERLTKARLHQPIFRARVLRAYTERCAMCRLHHPELLDAAHIIPDGHPHGDPVVPNGLSLCKIHHAAYDANLLGVRPDLVVEVQPRLLREIDGPMLTHGLKGMAGARLLIPRSKPAQPDPDRLEARYDRFRAAS